MTRSPRRIVLMAFIVVLVLAVVGIQRLLDSAPATTRTDTLQPSDSPRLPTVTGDNLEGVALTFPDVFTSDYVLVVMPFDQDQQERAVAYVPFFESLTAQFSDTTYYNIAPLSDLSPALRLLVTGGMRVAVSDKATRERIVILYLQDQQAFLDALKIPNTDEMRVALLDKTGRVLFIASGDYSESIAQSLTDALTNAPR